MKSSSTSTKVAPKKSPSKSPKVKASKKVAVKKSPAKVAKKNATKSKNIKSKPSTPFRTSQTIKDGAVTGIKRHPLGHLLLEKQLREQGFRGNILCDAHTLNKFSTDESIFSIKPQMVLQPRTVADVQIAVRVVAEQVKYFPSLSLTPRAAGTGLSGGSLTDSIVIDVCEYLRDIEPVEVKNNNVTITCEAGAMWRDVERRLRRHDAYLPPYPSSKDICSIGGSVANNAAGSDSLRYGHTSDWVESLEVILSDGNIYKIEPLTYKQFTKASKSKNEYGRILREVWSLIQKHEKTINANHPETRKNTAGYDLWHTLSTSVTRFKKGEGTINLCRLIAGGQGTVGIITKVTMRALPIQKHTALIAIPVFDLEDAAAVITKALDFNPINIELFDGLSYQLALQNPDFFKQFLGGLKYYRVMLAMYGTFHVRYKSRMPEFTFLITLDEETVANNPIPKILADISTERTRARAITNPYEAEALWQVRRSSYSLSKLQNTNRHPAAFLEDMVVPPEHLSEFFLEIKKLFREFKVTAAVHGHGGDGHFHFYPLLDFTNPDTASLIEKMSEKFFKTAVKYHGNICGEHNDGIIRTPHLNKLFSQKMIHIFEELENIFDPDDIFNPGKKVNPRFDIKTSIRKVN